MKLYNKITICFLRRKIYITCLQNKHTNFVKNQESIVILIFSSLNNKYKIMKYLIKL